MAASPIYIAEAKGVDDGESDIPGLSLTISKFSSLSEAFESFRASMHVRILVHAGEGTNCTNKRGHMMPDCFNHFVSACSAGQIWRRQWYFYPEAVRCQTKYSKKAGTRSIVREHATY